MAGYRSGSKMIGPLGDFLLSETCVRRYHTSVGGPKMRQDYIHSAQYDIYRIVRKA